MKLPPFDYACPATVAEAVALLASHGGEAKPLAGGQSLVPMLAFRLAAPALIVDLRKLDELRHIKIADEGVTLGAMVRWKDILEHPRLRRAHPLLVSAVEHVAHYQIRNRGTVGGSIAHADPAAELRRSRAFQAQGRALKGGIGNRTRALTGVQTGLRG